MNDSPRKQLPGTRWKHGESHKAQEPHRCSLLLLALSDPVAEKKLEKLQLEPNISLVHSVTQIKWAKDHIKTKSVYQR